MISFRLADSSDIHDVSVLLGSLFEEVEHTIDAQDIAEMFEEIESDDHHSTLLAINDDDDIVGILTIVECLSISAGGKYGAINELYVVPEYRSEGVGKMLIDQAKELAESREWNRLEVTTPGDDFSKTLRFYEREGFYKIGPRFCFRVD
ncbi:MAG: GNAT family N-acetyltransferase [Saprospiraceae bacterium]|nr:GNAT family N-acetyltransferase [Saprospiraceae bacterium]